MKSVSIIGTGNVAYHLCKAILGLNNWSLVQVLGRRKDALEDLKLSLNNLQLQTTTQLDKLIEVDVILCCVSDHAITNLINTLPKTNAVVAHTSGATALQNSAQHNAVFYPLQTFSKSKALEYEIIPICVEADTNQGFKLTHQLARDISDHVYQINSNQRLQLHLAAVFANNFSNYMVKIAEDLCVKHGINSAILNALTTETFSKLTHMSADNAQTGPAKRQDQNSIAAHIKLLEDSPYKAVYQSISEQILKDYGKKL